MLLKDENKYTEFLETSRNIGDVSYLQNAAKAGCKHEQNQVEICELPTIL